MVFGKKCFYCGKDANAHSQQIVRGKVVSDIWLCKDCYSSETTCDNCGKVIPSKEAIMDPDHHEVLCPVCCKKGYPEYFRAVEDGLSRIRVSPLKDARMEG